MDVLPLVRTCFQGQKVLEAAMEDHSDKEPQKRVEMCFSLNIPTEQGAEAALGRQVSNLAPCSAPLTPHSGRTHDEMRCALFLLDL